MSESDQQKLQSQLQPQGRLEPSGLSGVGPSDSAHTTQQLDSEALALSLKRQFERDVQQVASGEVDAIAFAAISPEMARSSKVTFSKIDFDELTKDYTVDESSGQSGVGPGGPKSH